MMAVKRRPATLLERLFHEQPPAYVRDVTVLTYAGTCPNCNEGLPIYNDDGKALGSEFECKHCGQPLVMPKRLPRTGRADRG